jgi:hypothetical protein
VILSDLYNWPLAALLLSIAALVLSLALMGGALLRRPRSLPRALSKPPAVCFCAGLTLALCAWSMITAIQTSRYREYLLRDLPAHGLGLFLFRVGASSTYQAFLLEARMQCIFAGCLLTLLLALPVLLWRRGKRASMPADPDGLGQLTGG